MKMVVRRYLAVIYIFAVCIGLCSAAPRLLRVPKVYNAIINSSDNLAPSRAFPLIQPVVHETALGYPQYPLSPPLIYHQPQLPFPLPGLPPRNDVPLRSQPESDKPKDEPGLEPNPSELSPQYPTQPQTPSEQTPPKPNQDKPASNQPPENPLKLNEFGLPPSLVPVQQYAPRVTYPYDPYNPYPFYSDPYSGVLLPYNPYFPSSYPYSLNPYPFYVPQPQDGQPQQPQWPFPQPEGPPQEQQPPQQQPPQQQPPQQQEINIKNNANKNSNIPDVPPPPLPSAGQRKAN